MHSFLNFLEARSVSFGYPQKKLLFKDLSLIIREGEKIALEGPNGVGKTTLFRMLMGLIRPVQGDIFLKETLVETPPQWRELRHKVGLLFQDSDDQLFCPTLLEDVAFGPRNMGLSPEKARQKSMEVLESLGMAHHASSPPYTLSGGEKKLGALGTILSMSPELMLLDEPGTALDTQSRQTLVNILKSFPGMLVVASHDKELLREVTDTAMELKDGKIVSCGFK